MKRYSSTTGLFAEVTPAEHQQVLNLCIEAEITLKEWLHDAIIEKIERDNERI